MQANPVEAAPPPTGIRALVVDDSRAQRRVLALQLQRWGYDVTEAESATQGLALSEQAPFDIIISDWMMPGLSGVEFCREGSQSRIDGSRSRALWLPPRGREQRQVV